MKYRVYNRVYAFLEGYFWLACPICKQMFGGHERPRTNNPDYVTWVPVRPGASERGLTICPDCTDSGQGCFFSSREKEKVMSEDVLAQVVSTPTGGNSWAEGLADPILESVKDAPQGTIVETATINEDVLVKVADDTWALLSMDGRHTFSDRRVAKHAPKFRDDKFLDGLANAASNLGRGAVVTTKSGIVMTKVGSDRWFSESIRATALSDRGIAPLIEKIHHSGLRESALS